MIKVSQHWKNMEYIFIPAWRKCKKCGSLPKDHEVRNFDRMWGEGDVYCLKCGEYVRMYDTG